MEKCKATETMDAGVVRGNGAFNEGAFASGVYTATCIGADGQVKWTEEFKNTVCTVGKNFLLDTAFAGTANNLRLGLKGTGTETGTGTYSSHAAWAEITTYTGSRPTPSFSAASAGSKATSSAASFSINGTATVTGCFLVMAAAVGTLGTVGDTVTTGGVLYSAGDFGSSKSVTSGDTLNVSYTASL